MDGVLAHYGPAVQGLNWRRVESGFSAAAVWVDANLLFALKSWPPSATLDEIQWKHARQQELVLPFSSRLIPNMAGQTCTRFSDRFWELTDWKPGEPARELTPTRMAAVCHAIAAMHRAWSGHAEIVPVDPLLQRCQFVNRLIDQCNLEAAAARALPDPVSQAARWLRKVDPRPVRGDRFLVQPIHGDLHREHLLFSGDAVSGVIDFASVKLDDPAVDLARYLGEFENVDLSPVLAVYRDAGGSREVTLPRIAFLMQVVAQGAAANWILRFAHKEAPIGREAAALARLERIVKKLANSVSGTASFP